ncbi:MAG: 9-O-acetylesterase [Armatimonadetes bacterium]|nr:9-O-acetylesterase [Armatimonadota bacterium]
MVTMLLPLLAVAQAASMPFVSPAFGDHMVLQRDLSAPIWGWTNPGAKVTVSVAGKTVTTVAAPDGRWMARLPAMPAGGPYDVRVEGPKRVVLRDVLFGDVRICSGQSNMEQGIAIAKNPEEEIANASHPKIRLFMTERRYSLNPEPVPQGEWKVCTPQTVAEGGWGGFSAVAYYFGRELQREVKVPIGLIQTCWGGTPAEAWTSAEALAKMPDFAALLRQLAELRADREKALANRQRALETLIATADQGTKENWQTQPDGPAWKPVARPMFEGNGLDEFDGFAWFRATVKVPEALAGREAFLQLGAIDDQDTVWINGRLVGSTEGWSLPRHYALPKGLLKAGENVLTVRVLDTMGAGGLTAEPSSMFVDVDGQRLALENWRMRPSSKLPANFALPPAGPEDQNSPTVLFNAMIHPWLPYGIKGAIWYQGESNAGRAYQYRTLLPTMIRDWRSRWGVGKFPFLIVQLANFMQRQPAPGDDAWAELREAQNIAAKVVGNAAVAVIIDAGDAQDIHPKDKQTVGKRLALAALRVAYGRKGPYLSPEYRSMTVRDGKAILTFAECGSGLVARNGAPRGFAIAGADRKWHWAQAEILGPNKIAVWSPEVPNPVAVRYAWASNPLCNVYSAEGLPLSPFRTDDWPMITGPKR